MLSVFSWSGSFVVAYYMVCTTTTALAVDVPDLMTIPAGAAHLHLQQSVVFRYSLVFWYVPTDWRKYMTRAKGATPQITALALAFLGRQLRIRPVCQHMQQCPAYSAVGRNLA